MARSYNTDLRVSFWISTNQLCCFWTSTTPGVHQTKETSTLNVTFLIISVQKINQIFYIQLTLLKAVFFFCFSLILQHQYEQRQHILNLRSIFAIRMLVNPSYTLTNVSNTALENVDVTTYILHPLQCQCRSLRDLHCHISLSKFIPCPMH